MNSEIECSQVKLNVDEACVTLRNPLDVSNLWLYTLSSDCNLCPYKRKARLFNSINSSVKINTARSQIWRVIETSKNEEYISASNKDGVYCQFKPNVGEHGIYEFELVSNGSFNFYTIREPQNEYIPLAIAFGLIFLLLSSLSIFKLIKSYINKQQSASENEAAVKNSGAKRRVRSIDTVRGMSILLMIFVNNGAGGYPYLEHATWTGLHIGDLVFPCFMWIMGVCIPLSISSQLSRGTPRLVLSRAIVKRSVYLFLIGICLNTLGGRNQLEKIRIFGVLQRFSVAYLVAGISYAMLIRFNTEEQPQKKKLLDDITTILPLWMIAFFILACHSAITFLWAVPGCPRGYLGPGGRHAEGKYLNCTGGAAGYVDKVLLGVNHIYQFPTANSVYGSGPFDPEGVLGSLTSIFQVFLGVQFGQTLREYKKSKSRLARWIVWAVVLGLIGSALHFTNVVPFNKNLWSISFVMITSGISVTVFIICYLLVDVFQIWEGGPFRVPGMNALVMYVGHQIFSANLPFRWKYGEMNTHSWLLTECLWCVGLWCGIAYILHHKRKYFAL